MKDLARIYDHPFFEPYSGGNPAYADSCALIAAEIHRRYQPASVVDWGCGAGLHLAELAERGSRVLGVDGSQAAIELAGPVVPVVRADLREPVQLSGEWADYHLALCIDVLEHVAEEHAAAVLQNVVRGARAVILSCAPPHQGGHHHVNEQPRRYWVQKMANLGWQYQRSETGALESAFLPIRERIAHTWMFHNLCVYRPEPRDGRPHQPARALIGKPD